MVGTRSSAVSPCPSPSFLSSQSPVSLPIADCFCFGKPTSLHGLLFPQSSHSLTWLPPCWLGSVLKTQLARSYLRAFSLAISSAWVLPHLSQVFPQRPPSRHPPCCFTLHTQHFPALPCLISPCGSLLLSPHFTVTSTRQAVCLVSSTDMD